MKGKKSGDRDLNKWVIVGVFVLVILFLVGGYFYLNRKDPLNLVPRDSKVTGNAFYSNVPLTLDQLRKGVNLDRWWNSFYWTNEIKEDLEIEVAFETIIDNTAYVYSYNENKYWFHPGKRYGYLNNHQYYKNFLFDTIKPGNRYGVNLDAGDVLVYTTGPLPMKIIFPEGYERDVTGDELICVNNESYVNCGGETDGGLDYNVKGMVVNVSRPLRGVDIRANGDFEILEDKCVNNTRIEEYYCHPNRTWYGAEVHTVDCPNGRNCLDGKCVGGGEDEIDVSLSYFVHGDGKKITITVNSTTKSGTFRNILLLYDNPLTDTTPPWSASEFLGEGDFDCDGGTSCDHTFVQTSNYGEGVYRFVAEAYTKTNSKRSEIISVNLSSDVVGPCYDSDGGHNITVEGFVVDFVSKEAGADSCHWSNNKILFEKNCRANGYVLDQVTCLNECVEGVCI